MVQFVQIVDKLRRLIGIRPEIIEDLTVIPFDAVAASLFHPVGIGEDPAVVICHRQQNDAGNDHREGFIGFFVEHEGYFCFLFVLRQFIVSRVLALHFETVQINVVKRRVFLQRLEIHAVRHDLVFAADQPAEKDLRQHPPPFGDRGVVRRVPAVFQDPCKIDQLAERVRDGARRVVRRIDVAGRVRETGLRRRKIRKLRPVGKLDILPGRRAARKKIL